MSLYSHKIIDELDVGASSLMYSEDVGERLGAGNWVKDWDLALWGTRIVGLHWVGDIGTLVRSG